MDMILTGGTVLTMDGQKNRRAEAVAVRDGKIAAVGASAEIAALEARVLGAPAAVREALFEIEAGAVRALRDRKVIFRAERR